MASKITVTVGYEDGSKKFSEDWRAADNNPQPEVIKDCENQTVQKWLDMGNSGRGLRTTVRVTNDG